MATNGAQPKHHRDTKNEKLVIAASSLGTVFEWYDFYLYGPLATTITSQFFSGVNEMTGFILALAAFAAGFAVRPFGALVFGRIGDIVGRKNTFLVTMGIMGASTFAVGLLPSYAAIGVAAPAAPGRTASLLQGSCARRAIWRCRDLRRRARARSQARALHELDPDDRDARPLRVTAGRDRRTPAIGEAALASWGWRVLFLALGRCCSASRSGSASS